MSTTSQSPQPGRNDPNLQDHRGGSHLRNARDLFVQLDDTVRQARTHVALVRLLGKQQRNTDALRNGLRALELSRADDDRSGEAMALNSVGWSHAQLGNYQQTLVHCRQALTLFSELGNRYGTAYTLDSLGYAHHNLGHHEQAIGRYQQAVDIFRELDVGYSTATTLTRLGDTRLAAGDTDTARSNWLDALAILDDLDHPDADQVRARLVRASGDAS